MDIREANEALKLVADALGEGVYQDMVTGVQKQICKQRAKPSSQKKLLDKKKSMLLAKERRKREAKHRVKRSRESFSQRQKKMTKGPERGKLPPGKKMVFGRVVDVD